MENLINSGTEINESCSNILCAFIYFYVWSFKPQNVLVRVYFLISTKIYSTITSAIGGLKSQYGK